jgi:hypothetical protein
VQQRAEQLHGSRVSPLEVVEHEDERLGRREQFEQRANGAMSAVALVLERHAITAAHEGRKRGKDVGELRTDVPVQRIETLRLESLYVLIERVHKDPERQITFELRGASREDALPAGIGAGGKLDEHACLADTGFANDFDRSRRPPSELGEDVFERGELRSASDEMCTGRLSHP